MSEAETAQLGAPEPALTAPGAGEKSSLWGRLRSWSRWLLQLDDSSESIARGLALGIFVGMTPTVGIQMGIVAIVNTLAKANRMAGVAMVYISNPLTMIPIYWFDYQIGRWILGQPDSIDRAAFERIFRLEGPNLYAKLQDFVIQLAQFSWEVAGPLFLGGFVLGAALGLMSYPLALRMIRRYRGETSPEALS